MAVAGAKLMILDNSGGSLASCMSVLRHMRYFSGVVGDLVVITVSRFSRAILVSRVSTGVVYLGVVVSVCYWVNRSCGPSLVAERSGIVVLNKSLEPFGKRMSAGGVFFELRRMGFMRVLMMAKGIF